MTQSGKGVRDTAVLFTCFAFSLVPIACSSSEVTTSGGVTVVSSGTLEEFEGYIPIAPDSVVELYRTYNQQRFYERYGEEVRRTAVLLDSLNQDIPPSQRIDTLSIEFALEQFGSAVRKGRSIVYQVASSLSITILPFSGQSSSMSMDTSAMRCCRRKINPLFKGCGTRCNELP